MPCELYYARYRRRNKSVCNPHIIPKTSFRDISMMHCQNNRKMLNATLRLFEEHRSPMHLANLVCFFVPS